MFKAAILGLILILASARTYPMYKQCDSQWGSEQMGNGGETICAYGSMLSSIAMGLTGTGHNYNPGTLNTWLKSQRWLWWWHNSIEDQSTWVKFLRNSLNRRYKANAGPRKSGGHQCARRKDFCSRIRIFWWQYSCQWSTLFNNFLSDFTDTTWKHSFGV